MDNANGGLLSANCRTSKSSIVILDSYSISIQAYTHIYTSNYTEIDAPNGAQ